ncbi:MAG: PQQ-binding-like beta-propeller repeat protein, partial [Candidatus Thermoplasmatota archaeon]|nr:PQQ-binding-like beta-propeller repeat protein [Candidatus Thermoplasmatota archaeon]
MKEKKETKETKEISIEDLPGVGGTTAERLREAGYSDLMAIAVASPAELAEIEGISEGTAVKIIAGAKKEADVGGFETGDIIMERRKEVGKLTTCSSVLNELMGGGFESQGITAYVIAGRSVSGADLYYYWTRIYAFDVESGRVLWKYPENEVMDSSVSWIDVSSDGKYIAFEIFVFTKAGKRGERKYKDGEVVVLNGEGKKLWSYEKPILPYQDNSWGYRGISFSKDGKYLTSTDAYGAGYLFDNE